MKWSVHPTPKIGTIRYKVKFAFIPTLTQGGYRVWLEKYLEKQIFVGDYYWSGYFSIWQSTYHHNDSFEWRQYYGEGIKTNKR